MHVHVLELHIIPHFTRVTEMIAAPCVSCIDERMTDEQGKEFLHQGMCRFETDRKNRGDDGKRECVRRPAVQGAR